MADKRRVPELGSPWDPKKIKISSPAIRKEGSPWLRCFLTEFKITVVEIVY